MLHNEIVLALASPEEVGRQAGVDAGAVEQACWADRGRPMLSYFAALSHPRRSCRGQGGASTSSMTLGTTSS